MKFIHIADMHFDKSFSMLSSKGNFGKIRRIDQRTVFQTIIQYIKENEIPYLFISGDFYEHTSIRRSTIEYIDNLFKTIPNTKIFITPGNHDPNIKNSMYQTYLWNENVKIFSQKVERIETEDADIYGVGFDDFHVNSLNVENIKIINPNKINILITHGSLNASSTLELQYNPLNRNNLKTLNFDYVALGHIHKLDYQTDEIVYPGSTIAMGFDELGKHGMIEGNLTKEKLELKFIPVDNKEFKELEFDVTEISDEDELIEKLNNLELQENNLYKIILCGKRNFEIDILNLYKFILNENIIKIKDKTKLNYSLEEIANDTTLKGIFAKQILEETNKENYTKEELEKIAEIGFSVLE